MDNSDNNKKILCVNIINNKVCNYGNKCMYAHNLSEQKIEPIRKLAYDIIMGENEYEDEKNYHNIDLVNNENLFNTLKTLTRVCSFCYKKICPGGYNCRNGVVLPKYKICYEDLMTGNCQRNNCLNIHLTKKGLVPMNIQKAINSNKDVFLNISDTTIKKNTIWNNFPKSILVNKKKNIIENKTKVNSTEIKGILLTEKILQEKFSNNQTSTYSSESEDYSEIEKISKYINDNLSDSQSETKYDESIFEK